MEYKIFDTLPSKIPSEILAEAKANKMAIICRTPQEHPSECTYLVIGPLGNKLAKFKYPNHAVRFVTDCLEDMSK